MPYVLVDPESKLDFAHDWVPYLAEGDTIASRLWSIRPTNPGSPSTPLLSGETTDICFVEGCEAGKVYHLTERVVTANGVRDERTIVLRCENQ